MKMLKKNIIKKIAYMMLFLWALPVFAQNQILDRVKKAASGFWKTEVTSDTAVGALANFVGTLISILLSLIGALFLILIIYSGFRWMFARGNEEEVKAAQKTMLTSIQGLIIVVVAYAIVSLVGFFIAKFGALKP